VHTLTDTEFHIKAEPLLRQVFIHEGAYQQPFAPDVTDRKIIYPCYGNFKEAVPVEALIAAATEIGDTGCYISRGIYSPGEPIHCYVPLSELYEGYAGEPGSDKLIGAQLGMHVYNIYITIFSDTGRWGILITDDGMALLGGTSEFIQALQKYVPNLDAQVHLFLESLQVLKDDGLQLTIEWLPGLLTHIYGEEISQKLLQETELLK
jgi:hypothetical protein